MIEIDLHLHTTFSDGRLTPTKLVRMCNERGLKIMAVTDHDSTEGLDEALEAASEFTDMTIVPGIELSTDIPGAEIHLLGLFINRNDKVLQRQLSTMRKGRQGRARAMVKNLEKFGVFVSWEHVEKLAGEASIGRPHIAQAMVEAGYVKFPKEAFDRYLGRSGPAYAERVKLSPEEAVKLLLANGAVPVIAHPTYSAAKSSRGEVEGLRDILTSLKAAGLVGMEVYYGDYTAQQIKWLGDLADEFNLIPCGGSDYHASGNPGEPEPGSVGPPRSTYERLQEARTHLTSKG